MTKLSDITKKIKQSLDRQEVEVNIDPKFQPEINVETGGITQKEMRPVVEMIDRFNQPFSYAYMAFLETVTSHEQAVYLTDFEKGIPAFRSWLTMLSNDQLLRYVIDMSPEEKAEQEEN